MKALSSDDDEFLDDDEFHSLLTFNKSHSKNSNNKFEKNESNRHVNELIKSKIESKEARNLQTSIDQYKLAKKYAYGKVVRKDMEKAIELYKKASYGGYNKAHYELGICYAYGNGVIKIEERALELITKAAEQGYTKAQIHLATLHSFHYGVDSIEFLVEENDRIAHSIGLKKQLNKET